MTKLLNKEFRLAAHPTNFLFLGLSAMLIIPNYPYYVTFFYTCLGLFFTCLSGRENHDIYYSMTLPIKKRDVVKARFAYAVIFELLQAAVAVPFAILRQSFKGLPQNEVGMEANIAFFGLAFIMLGVFNLVFFTRYYRDPDKVGGSFNRACVATFVFIMFAEASAHVVPFVKAMDCPDPEQLGAKLITLAVGILLYALLTFAAYKKSIRLFEALDL